MKITSRVASVLLSVFFFCCYGVLAQTTDNQRSFEEKLYSIAPISHFGMDPQKFVKLNDSQKRDVIASRDVLIALLRGLQFQGDISQYISSGLARQYKSSAELAASIMDPETSIIAAGVTDFSFVNGATEIELNFFAVVSAEGNIVVSKGSATATRVGLVWRITKFD